MGIYDDMIQLLKEAEGSNEYEQMLSVVQDSFGEIVRDFCSVRQHVLEIATLPDASLKDAACGSPPYVIEDGETNYAVIWANGQVDPLPVGFEVAEDDLKIDAKVSKFVIPFGTTVNMDGTALYQVIAVFFLAQLFSIELSIISILVIIVTTLLASIGTPAIPGAGVIVLSTILVTVGIPPIGIILLISVDRILDMTRTMVNVTGDLTASCVFDKITQEKTG